MYYYRPADDEERFRAEAKTEPYIHHIFKIVYSQGLLNRIRYYIGSPMVFAVSEERVVYRIL